MSVSSSNGCDIAELGDEMTFENRLFINHESDADNTDTVVDDNGSGNVGGNDDEPTGLAALIASLMAKIDAWMANPTPVPPTPPTPVKPAVCALLGVKMIGTVPGETNVANTTLQQHLIANGYAHVITWGATGYYGEQTKTAVMQAHLACAS